jgi:DNA-binding protein H-NS
MMGERKRNGNGQTNIDGNETSVEEKIATVVQIVETLDYPELLRLRDLISEEYKRKVEAARPRVIAETQQKFEQLGLSFEDVMNSQRKRKRVARTPTSPKYRSTDGREWSGRGAPPKWIREIEETGGNREDYRISDNG